MADLNTDCVVIRVNDYGESDKLVTLYCPEAGRLNVIAKGAKRSKKRFVNKLEIFSHLNIQYNDKYKLPLITEATLLASFLPLRQHFPSYSTATLICEHLYYWIAENNGEPELFDWLIWSFNALAVQRYDHDRMRRQSQFNENNLPQNILILFLAKLYGILGYQPDLRFCSKCNKLNLADGPFGFKTGRGVLICQKCSLEDRPAIPLAIPTIKLLDKAFGLPMDKISRLKFSLDSSNEALNMFQYYGKYLLDRDFQSWRFVFKTSKNLAP